MANLARTDLSAAASRVADEWFTPGRFLVLLAVCLFAAFPEVVLGSHTFYYRDFGHFGYPLAQYHRECFWRGEIPLWNPYNSCGLPHLAQWNTMCLYPGTLIYLLGPMPWAVGLFSLAHLMLAGAGAYRLAHHWTGNRFAATVGGLAFAFNGFTLHAVMWPNNVAALAWTPWLWLLVERGCKEGGRTLLLAALVGAMQMLAGAPEVILFTWGVGGVLRVACCVTEGAGTQHATRSTQGFRFVAIAAITFLLSAAQLLPFLDLLRHSHRTLAYDDNLYAMPLWGWANFFVPLFRMTPDRLGVFSHVEQQWTSSYYPGIGVLALAALAVWRRREPRVWLLAVVAVVGVWLAMGQKAFLLDWVKAVCPPLGFIRFPIKYVLLPLMVLPFLAAIGAHYFSRPGSQPYLEGPEFNGPSLDQRLDRGADLGIAVFGITGVLCVMMDLAWLIELGNAADPQRLTFHARNAVLQIVFLICLGAAARTGLFTGSPQRRNWFLLVVGFAALDILTYAPRQNPTVITQAYEPDVAKFFTTMPRLGEGRAMISREMEGFMAHAQNADALNYCIGARRALFANWNLIDGVPKVNGFFSQFPRELSDTWWLLYGLDRPFPNGFADFLGITRISSSETLFTWSHRTNALPLVTAGQQPIFASGTNTLRALASADFNPAQVVYLPEELRASASVTNVVPARILAPRWGMGAVEFEVEASAPAWVVIAQTYYHPWKAFLSGREVPIHRANHAFQAIEVPAGRHAIELRYVDSAFRLGVILSLSTLACVLLILFRRTRPLPTTEH